MSSEDALRFGGARFSVRQRLGAGGMGVVYAAYDRDHATTVALKTLRRFDGAALYRFKQEFRSLADLNHPNLAALYELISEDEDWFFTMELVDGVRFTDYASLGYDSARVSTQEGVPDSDEPIDLDLVSQRIETRRHCPAHPERLAGAVLQLSLGLRALHDAGKLHRDIKPSNVLVTASGRVVVLDFGLVTELATQRRLEGREQFVAGTAEYMAPEQAAGLPLTPASDWYGVGVMMYEALAGRRPFRGETRQILADKQRVDPLPPSAFVTEVPPALERLAMDLLDRNPRARPDAEAIARVLGGERGRVSMLSWSFPALDDDPSLVGRIPHLAELDDAFAEVLGGKGTTVLVRGRSGMGKSALVRAFIDGLRKSSAAYVLAARCHERESVPYKAVDSLVDELSRLLVRLPLADIAAIVPKNVYSLARLFPVLLEVCAAADLPIGDDSTRDVHELRRRAFDVLRELLVNLSKKRPIVMCVDDLHWGDADSASLLAHVLRGVGAPRALFVACYRSEETAVPALLERLLDEDEPRGGRVGHEPRRVREIELGPLDRHDAFQLAIGMMDRDDDDAIARAKLIAEEAAGSPFFVQELVRYAQLAPGAEHLTLEEVLGARLATLEPEHRTLLALVALAGRPLGQGLVLEAARLGERGRPAIHVLRSARFVRTRGATDADAIETYHDRIRAAVVAQLDPAQTVAGHASLAAALEASRERDPEALAIHYRGAGQPAKAADYAERAAVQAAFALAFDRAAELYRLTLELREAAGNLEEQERSRLEEQLGEALANAGRGADAAEAFLAAARGAELEHGRELTRRAAEQLLRSGRVDQGLEVIREVLEGVGLELARTPMQALRSLLMRRAQLRLRGIGFTDRAADAIAPAELRRIDTCWAVGAFLSTVDNVRGAEFQTRHLLLALAAGEPYRVARALATEAAYAANAGGPGSKRATTLLDAAAKLAGRIEDDHASGLVEAVTGIVAYEEGRYAEGRQHLDIAERMFKTTTRGAAWEIETSQLFALMSLAHLGEVAELTRRVSHLLEDAIARGDLYAETNFRIGYPNLAWLVGDNVDGARRSVLHALEGWSRRWFNAQHFYALLAQTNVDLYAGDGKLAYLRMRDTWSALSRSLLLRVQFLRIESLWLRARSALAASKHADERDARRMVAEAEKDARRIAKEKMRWSAPIADLTLAGVAARRGDHDASIAALERAIEGFDGTSMRLYAASARWWLGRRLGGEGGRKAFGVAVQFMNEQKVRKPARLVEVFAPGFGD